MDSWTLTATEPAAGLLYLANGYLGTSLHWDGGLLFDSAASPCYIRGVYNGTGQDGIDRLADIPCWHLLHYGAPATVQEYRRELDLHRGILRTSFVLEEARGRVRLTQTIFLSRADGHQAAVRIASTPEFDGEITFHARLAVPTGGEVERVEAGVTQGVPASGAGPDGRSIYLLSRSRTYDITIAQVLTVEEDDWQITDSVEVLGIARILQIDGRAGQEATLTQLVRVATSLDGPDPLRLARDRRAGAGPEPASRHQESRRYEAVLAEHTQAWDRLWQTDVEIDGDDEVQRFVRAGLFYLWSTVREEDRWSIAPMGLSSNGYNGHIFWDAELWMYPTLLVTQPELARSCVAYRRHTLPAARARAASNGYEGAQFPWEAAFTGEEMTPFWCDTRDYQLHITADVAIGQWWYFLATGDRDWLRDEGFPVMCACAEYWASRVEYRRELDRYEISDVVCADEYAAHVNNDAFTNAAVRHTFRLAIRAAEILGEAIPAKWSEIADRVYIPYDGANRRHVEFDGFAGQVTKQADVELLAFPLEHTTDPEQIARDLDYYATVIDPNGPAMSFSVYSIVSAQLGRAAAAYEYLKRSYVPNTRPPFFSFSETPINNEFFFCTGVGGALQAILFGFTGLRLREGRIHLNPILPEHWRSLRLRNLAVAGARVDIEIRPDSFTVCRQEEDDAVSVAVDRARGEVKLTTGDGERPDLELSILGDNGATLWRGAAAPGQPILLPENNGAEMRLQVQLEGRSALELAFAPRVGASIRT